MRITPGMFRYSTYHVYLSTLFVAGPRFILSKSLLSDTEKRLTADGSKLRAFIEEDPNQTADGLRILVAKPHVDQELARTIEKRPAGIGIKRTAVCVHLRELTERYDTEGEYQRAYVRPDGTRVWFDDALVTDLGTPDVLYQTAGEHSWTTGEVSVGAWGSKNHADVPALCEAALREALPALLKAGASIVTDAPVTVVSNRKVKRLLAVEDGGAKKKQPAQRAEKVSVFKRSRKVAAAK